MFMRRVLRTAEPGQQRTMFDDKDIVSSAFGNLSRRVQHNAFLASGLTGLDLCQHIVQIIERLDPWIEAFRRNPAGRKRDDFAPLPIALLRIELDRADNDDDRRLFTRYRINAANRSAGDNGSGYTVARPLPLRYQDSFSMPQSKSRLSA
jgi:hypothetical protein